MGVMELEDAAIATSGDYRHWVDIAGQSYAHTLDPSTGAPCTTGWPRSAWWPAACMITDCP